MMKKAKTKQAHTSQSKIGMGDYYGSAIKQKVGRAIDVMGSKSLSSRKLSKPPKSLA